MVTIIFPYSHKLSRSLFFKDIKTCFVINISFPNNKILDSTKLKEFADDNFKFDENGRKFSKWLESTGKRRNCFLQATSPIPTVFSEDLHHRQVKSRACFGKGWTTCNWDNIKLKGVCFFPLRMRI